MQENGQVTAVFFGDGAVNRGPFHENINIGAVWNLPVVFVCENNLYMEYTPIDLITAVPEPVAASQTAAALVALALLARGSHSRRRWRRSSG